MKKVKSLKALVLSLMLCLAMGTTAFASEVSTQGQAAPNESGTDYLQGTITLVGNDGTSAPVQIANYSGDSWTLTFTGVKVGVRYHFHYELYSVGSSQVGYIASAAYAQ